MVFRHDCPVFSYTVGYLCLADATVSMVVATDTVAEDVGTRFISVCADPGVAGIIDLELVATLDASDIKASESSYNSIG